ncbi:CocE/NonD family hydrolase [Planococcus sp. 1R117A]|uniref:CocE/NonD family hydrolase n=1 Tax=Planococcus sp. 1R117A TaxID=3447020 RepID=UPI003EDBE461
MRYIYETDIKVPMRDGIKLATNIWRPEGDKPAPTLLVRNPYGMNNLPSDGTIPNLLELLEAGYAIVYQDCRGSFNSEGDYVDMANEPEDGVDTLDWLSNQPWCDGNIGTYGPSYLGFVQWASVTNGGNNLKAIAPSVTSSDYYKAPWYSDGGAFSLHTSFFWITSMGLSGAMRKLTTLKDPNLISEIYGDLQELTDIMDDPTPHLSKMPLNEQEQLKKHSPLWSEWLEHPSHDEYWTGMATIDKIEEVKVPALNIGGWYDILVNATLASYTAMKQRDGSEAARKEQLLIIGPWDHGSYQGIYPDRQFGIAASIQAVDTTTLHRKFFDRWLRGEKEALEGMAPVRIFVMGIDQWRDEQDWPLPDTQYTDYFLASSGQANTSEGDGILRSDSPQAEQKDTYTYDPLDPVPTLGGRTLMPVQANSTGPVDQSPLKAREDVLFYSTPVLEKSIEVTGHVSLNLYASSSALDTDFTGKLVDVFPDGRSIILTEGILRARYRKSLSEPELLEPDEIYELTLDLGATSNVFLPGHRIMLEVSSSNFPRYDRNTNTGDVIAMDMEDQMVTAVNSIYHGSSHPSRLVLPIINRN